MTWKEKVEEAIKIRGSKEDAEAIRNAPDGVMIAIDPASPDGSYTKVLAYYDEIVTCDLTQEQWDELKARLEKSFGLPEPVYLSTPQ